MFIFKEKNDYVSKKVIIWKHIMHQRTESVECANVLGQTI